MPTISYLHLTHNDIVLIGEGKLEVRLDPHSPYAADSILPQMPILLRPPSASAFNSKPLGLGFLNVAFSPVLRSSITVPGFDDAESLSSFSSDASDSSPSIVSLAESNPAQKRRSSIFYKPSPPVEQLECPAAAGSATSSPIPESGRPARSLWSAAKVPKPLLLPLRRAQAREPSQAPRVGFGRKLVARILPTTKARLPPTPLTLNRGLRPLSLADKYHATPRMEQEEQQATVEAQHRPRPGFLKRVSCWLWRVSFALGRTLSDDETGSV